jgi:hypothetical protein
MRAVYVFRNEFGDESPELAAHRLGDVQIDTGVNVNAVLPGTPIGVGGKGELRGGVRFATDPAVRVHPLLPWREAERSLVEYASDYFAEIALEVDVNPDVAVRDFENAFRPFLPVEKPEGWEVSPSSVLEGSDGDVVPFSVEVVAPTPGRTLIALQVEHIDDESLASCSEIVALEVTEQLEIVLLSDIEPEVEPHPDRVPA